ncbi:MAG: hypothetical protein GY953_48825, partial [bacterium]|nr:hypothetical protein [bacterium]
AVAAPALTRAAMMKAILARRTYAVRGGEPILVDFSADGHFMGSEYTASGPVKIEVKVTGTKPIRRIELVRNNKYILSKDFNDGGADQSISYRDMDTTAAYYYIRVWQSPGEWAWTSPIWADRE